MHAIRNEYNKLTREHEFALQTYAKLFSNPAPVTGVAACAAGRQEGSCSEQHHLSGREKVFCKVPQEPLWGWSQPSTSLQRGSCWSLLLRGNSTHTFICRGSAKTLRLLLQSTHRHKEAVWAKQKDIKCIWTYIMYHRLPVAGMSMLKYWQHFAGFFLTSCF